ncbi:MAG: amidohydrolase family protein [Pseudomonadota bacterium]
MTFNCLGPLANLTPVGFDMPPGATDTHSHVIGLPPDYPFVPERSYTPPEAPLAAYKAMHKALAIDRAVIVTPSVHGTDNRITVEAIAGYGPNARGIAVVDPDISEADLATLHAGGIRGVRLNVLFGGGVGLHAFSTLAPKVAELGWHVQLLIDVSRDLADLEAVIRETGVEVVIDHMGYVPAGRALTDPGFAAMLDLVRDGLSWVKLSGCDRISEKHPAYLDSVPVAQALLEAGPTRMVWGTDWPHVSKAKDMPDTGILLNRLADYAPDPAVRKAVLVDNPGRLYGFNTGAP